MFQAHKDLFLARLLNLSSQKHLIKNRVDLGNQLMNNGICDTL